MSAELIIQGWHTECGCGYGSGGWAASPSREGKQVLTPEMLGETCPGCGEVFTPRSSPYADIMARVAREDRAAEVRLRGEERVAELEREANRKERY